MPTDLREILDRAAGVVDSQPDVPAAWARGQRLRRQRRVTLSASIVAVILVGLLAAVAAVNRTDDATLKVAGHTKSTTVTKPRPILGTAGLSIDDITWSSPTHGWALGDTKTCRNPQRCPQALLKTTDGGDHWAVVETENTPQNCVFGCAPPDQTMNESNIRFANDEIGYAFGSGDETFMTTKDGGHTWVSQPGPKVTALEIAGGNVIRVTFSHTGCPGPCDLKIETAPVGSARWQPARAPALTESFVRLIRSGPNAAYLTLSSGGGGTFPIEALIASGDGGLTWTQRPSPCGPTAKVERVTYGMAAAPGSGAVASICSPQSGTGNFIVISGDGGRTFVPPQRLPAEVDGGAFVISSAENLFVGSFTGGEPGPVGARLYASHDGGKHWSVALTDGLPPGELAPSGGGVLQFWTPTDGLWLGYKQKLWTTNDGGLHWAQHSIR